MFTKLSLDQMQNFHDFHSGDPEGDVGEQLVEEAVDHRDDDDARPAALRHQLRHVLLHLHLLHRRPQYVEKLLKVKIPQFQTLAQILRKASRRPWEWAP